VLPVAGSAPSGVAAAAPVAPAPATTTTVTSTVTSAGPLPPAGPAAGFSYPFLVGGGPDIGFGSRVSASAAANARRKAPEPDSAAAVAGAAARARKRRRTALREYGDEFADMNVDVDPHWAAPPQGEPPMAAMASKASDLGARNLGFSGTARNEATDAAAGLTALADGEFGGGPRAPMLPRTWDPGRS
jgi:PPE-repeat protein